MKERSPYNHILKCCTSSFLKNSVKTIRETSSWGVEAVVTLSWALEPLRAVG